MANDMTRKPRRPRADSKESAVRDMMTAARVIAPPSDLELTKPEMVIFHEIIDELPRGEWTAHMVRLAASLARDMHAAAQEQVALRREGSVVAAANGAPIRNPRCVQLAALIQTILATRRSLSLHSRAKSSMDNRALSRRREIQRENEANAPDDEDELINRPLN